MTKINIISGFLGAGKTTFIKRLIEDVFKGEKLVLIENEFGEIGVDGGFLQDAGVQINEMVSGCICCSLVGDFTAALNETVNTYAPDRILIEPSGVGKLSDVIAAVQNTGRDDIVIDACITVVDCTKCRMYRKNFGEFYEDQLKNAACVLLSRTDKAAPEKLAQALDIIRDINPDISIITTPLSQLAPEQIVDALNKGLMEKELLAEALRAHEEHEHHHHHEHGEHCTCGCHDHEHHHHDHDEHECHEHHHHHDHDEHECHEHHHHHDHDEHECHEHHHHDHDEHECHEHHHHHDHDEHECHEHHHHDHDEHECHEHHHHDHGEHCTCGCHDHHHADETFTSWGFETARVYAREEIEAILAALDTGDYGMILRAKGMVNGGDGWIYFDYVPEESGVRSGSPCFTGRICVIGVDLDEDKLAELFHKSH